MSYSQHDEERHILTAVADCTTRRFLDIGAYHPTDKSNTRALFELGWAGIMIEPAPGPMKALLKEYGDEPRITLIEACCSLEPGLISLRVTDDAVSSSNAGVQKTWETTGGYFGSMLVPGLTLEQISNQFGGAFDFVNIDAEGVSVDIALRMLSLGWEPKCFCCETDGRLEELMIAATGKNFSLVYANGCNAVMVRG